MIHNCNAAMVAIHIALLKGNCPRLPAHLLAQIIVEIKHNHQNYREAKASMSAVRGH